MPKTFAQQFSEKEHLNDRLDLIEYRLEQLEDTQYKMRRQNKRRCEEIKLVGRGV